MKAFQKITKLTLGHLHEFARWAGGALVVLATALTVAGANAQSLCVPVASGVPALSGAPNFLDPAAVGPARYWPRLDDPRWRGALSRSFGTGASELASFRAVRVAGATPALYLSWFVKVDPSLDPFADSLRVAFTQTGADDQMMEVFPFTSLAASVEAGVPPSTTTRKLTAGAWTNQPAEPAWLGANTRVWLDTATQMWAINMRVPIAAGYDSGINLPATFRMAFELQVSQPLGGVVYHRFSTSVPLNDLASVPASGTWPQVNITASPPGGCIAGISIASTDIGTTYVDSGGNPRPHRMRHAATNTFFALPDNQSGTNAAMGAISATFRLANWGTQPDWNDIPSPTTSLWKQINLAPATNAGAINTGTKASVAGGNAITFNWTPTAAETCELVGQSGIPASQAPDGVAIPGIGSCTNATPTRRLHQCMLVELSGGGFTYTPASVYRNMDFVNASTFERQAEVSVAGLTALPSAANREVYLYVQKFQMPQNAAKPEPGMSLVDYKQLQEVQSRRSDQPTAASTTSIPKLPPLGGDFSTMNQLYPTYLVHAFHDSGATVTVSGQARRVLKPQSSFGYYVHHDGALGGWDTALTGAQEVAPNYYRIPVPQGGAATIQTRIVAREPGIPDFLGISWWWWLILLVVIVLVIVLLRRRSTP